MWIPRPKLNQVFSSRWKALLWVASIVLSAYYFIPKQDDDDSQEERAVSAAQRMADRPVWGAGEALTSGAQISPWALPDSADSASR